MSGLLHRSSARSGRRGSRPAGRIFARGRVGALGGAQLGRTRARIERDFRSSATTGFFVSTWKVGVLRVMLGSVTRHRAARLSRQKHLHDAIFERMKRHDDEPPAGLQDAFRRQQALCHFARVPRSRKCASAWKVRVAGWIAPGRARTTRATMSASASVVRIGAFARSAHDGARDRAGMPLLAQRRR